MILRKMCEGFKRIYAVLICSILVIALALIILRIGVKNVLYDRLGVNNAFVKFCLQGEDVMGEHQERLQEKKASIDMEDLYPFAGENPYSKDNGHNTVFDRLDEFKDKVDKAEDKLDKYTNFLLMGRNNIVACNENIKNLTGWNLYDDAILMDNGYAVGMSTKLDEDSVSEIADNIEGLNDYCSNIGIPFMYVHLAGKVNPKDKQIGCGHLDNSNENADMLLQELRSREIDIVDTRGEIERSGQNWDDWFYKTDGHWSTGVQLYIAGQLAKKLNEDYGFAYDTSVYDRSWYDIETFRGCWSGKGRVIEYRTGRDDFDLITPAFPTDLTYRVPSRAIDASGTYEDLFITADADSMDENEYVSWMNYYNAINVINDPLEQIGNNTASDNSDKSILVISDSFAWFLSSYLALDTGRVDKIYPPEFNGSIEEYIAQNKPDMVIVAYNIGQAVENLDLDNSRGAFDLK